MWGSDLLQGAALCLSFLQSVGRAGSGVCGQAVSQPLLLPVLMWAFSRLPHLKESVSPANF